MSKLRWKLAGRIGRIVPGVALATMLWPAAAEAAIPQVRKVGLVSLQRVINETSQGKVARKDFESSAKAKEQTLDKKQAKLQADAAKAKSLGGAQLTTLQEQMARDYQDLQSLYMTIQQDLAGEQERLLSKIYDNSKVVVDGLADRMGLDLVLVRDDMTVIYAVQGLDITDEVIKLYNQKFK